MDVWQVLSVVTRRWWVVLPLLALTVVGTQAARSGLSPEYQTEASVVFVRGSGDVVTNPLQDTTLAAAAMKIVLDSSDARARLSMDGPATAYEVMAAPRSSILSVRVRGRTTQEALRAGEEVLAVLDEQLDAHQAEIAVPERNRTVAQLLDAPDSALPSADGAKKTVVGLLTLGGAVSLAITVLIDDLLLHRRRGGRPSRALRSASTPDVSAQHEGLREPGHLVGSPQ